MVERPAAVACQRLTTRSLVVRRTLSDEQVERRARVVRAAMELAETGGYDAVVMKTVAERSGVALATLYRWFASKDHLLTEVLLTWGGELSETLGADPPTGPRPGGTGRRGPADGDGDARRRARSSRRRSSRPCSRWSRRCSTRRPTSTRWSSRWIDIALGDDELPDREEVVKVLELVCFASIIALVSGRETSAYARDQLAAAARLLLRR